MVKIKIKQSRLDAFWVPMTVPVSDHRRRMEDEDEEQNDPIQEFENERSSEKQQHEHNTNSAEIIGQQDNNTSTNTQESLSDNVLSIHVNKNHILKLLRCRSTCMKHDQINGSKTQMACQIQSFASRSRFGLCKSVRLKHNPLSQSCNRIVCLEFDTEGVLLASADSNGVISLFDFDELHTVS